jgi:Ca2+-dependent lipid-binding protein
MVVFKLNHRKEVSTHVSNTVDPEWNNQLFFFDVNDPENDILYFTVYDYESLLKNEFIGNGSLRLNELQRGVRMVFEEQLSNCEHGSITLELLAEDFGQEPEDDLPPPEYTSE